MAYLQDDKKISIKYTITDVGFSYNVRKGELKKGSTISKRVHPVKQVEDMKARLLKTGKLRDCGDYFVLKKSIITGVLMARNLHFGELVNTQNDDWKTKECLVFADDKIINELRLNNIMTSDSSIGKSCFLDSLRIKEISEVKIDFSFISEHNGNQFSQIEKLFFDELSKRNIISKNARHGITDNRECDIVDEENNLQIEVVTEFKNRIKKTKTPQKDFDSLGLECVGNIFIRSSNALLEKHYDKSYTDKYKKHLAIYCIGNLDAVLGLAFTIRENLRRRGKAKNHFEGLYIIWNDFVNNNKTYLMYLKNYNDQPIIEEITTDINLIKKRKQITDRELDSNDSETHYFLDTESIFSDTTPAVGILPGCEIIKLIKELRMII